MWLLIADFEYIDPYTDAGLNGGSVHTIFIITIILPEKDGIPRFLHLGYYFSVPIFLPENKVTTIIFL
jgi:hypothetical protein